MTELIQLDCNTQEVAKLKPSYLKFIQGSSEEKFGGKPGQFFDEDTGAVYDVLRCALIGSSTNRVKYPADRTHGGGIECKSDNGLVPAEYVENPKAETCAGCPFTFELHINSQGRVDRSRPHCKRMRKLALILKDTGLPHYLIANGSSEAPAYNLLEKVAKAKVMYSLQGYNLHEQDFEFEVRSVLRGNYAVMVFTQPQLVSDPAAYGPIYQGLIGLGRPE